MTIPAVRKPLMCELSFCCRFGRSALLTHGPWAHIGYSMPLRKCHRTPRMRDVYVLDAGDDKKLAQTNANGDALISRYQDRAYLPSGRGARSTRERRRRRRALSLHTARVHLTLPGRVPELVVPGSPAPNPIGSQMLARLDHAPFAVWPKTHSECILRSQSRRTKDVGTIRRSHPSRLEVRLGMWATYSRDTESGTKDRNRLSCGLP